MEATMNDDRKHSDILRELLILCGDIVAVEKKLSELRNEILDGDRDAKEEWLELKKTAERVKAEFLQALSFYEGVSNEKSDDSGNRTLDIFGD